MGNAKVSQKALKGALGVWTDKKLENNVNIARLKKFALECLPRDWPLCEVLLAENDSIPILVFLARLKIWLQLSSLKR